MKSFIGIWAAMTAAIVVVLWGPSLFRDTSPVELGNGRRARPASRHVPSKRFVAAVQETMPEKPAIAGGERRAPRQPRQSRPDESADSTPASRIVAPRAGLPERPVQPEPVENPARSTGPRDSALGASETRFVMRRLPEGLGRDGMEAFLHDSASQILIVLPDVRESDIRIREAFMIDPSGIPITFRGDSGTTRLRNWLSANGPDERIYLRWFFHDAAVHSWAVEMIRRAKGTDADTGAYETYLVLGESPSSAVFAAWNRMRRAASGLAPVVGELELIRGSDGRWSLALKGDGQS